MPGIDMFRGSPFLGGFFTAPPNRKWPVVMGPVPYGVWPATVAAVPGVGRRAVAGDEEWIMADALYREMYGMAGPRRSLRVR